MPKHNAPQIEIKWSEPEAFALTVQTALDGDRIATEAAQSAAARQYAEQQQSQFGLTDDEADPGPDYQPLTPEEMADIKGDHQLDIRDSDL